MKVKLFYKICESIEIDVDDEITNKELKEKAEELKPKNEKFLEYIGYEIIENR